MCGAPSVCTGIASCRPFYNESASPNCDNTGIVNERKSLACNNTGTPCGPLRLTLGVLVR